MVLSLKKKYRVAVAWAQDKILLGLSIELLERDLLKLY